VGIPNPEGRVDDYPHSLSGGQRQRVMIAMALACRPALLIADEPTTALDVTIQAQILELLNRLQEDVGLSILLITHDLGVIAETAHRVVVMYSGLVVEEAPVEPLFAEPKHPYTAGLLGAVPSLARRGERLATIPGNVPSPFDRPPGCPYATRCPYAMDVCRAVRPVLGEVAPAHRVRCHLYDVSDPRSGNGARERAGAPSTARLS
jgi:oligopeptide/dipeptide ABC transporter ATP-binding protein